MPNRTTALHTSEENIRRLDAHAETLRRSRNSLINEGIEMVLNHYEAAKPKAIATKPTKKAGTR